VKISRKTTTALAVFAAIASSAPAFAEIEANFGVTSNYVWRGVSQTGNDPSISGGLDYSHESGFYAGTWIGTIDFGNGGGTENDYYLGYGGETEGGFGYDVGYIYYNYPASGFEDSDFGEVYFNGSYGAFGFGLAYTVNSEVSEGSLFDTGDMFYSASYGFDLPEEYSLGLTVGYYDFDAGSDGDYSYFQADLSKGDFTLSVSKAEEDSGDDDTKIFVSWGMSF